MEKSSTPLPTHDGVNDPARLTLSCFGPDATEARRTFSSLARALRTTDDCLKAGGSMSSRLSVAATNLAGVIRSELPPALHADLECAIDAILKAKRGDLSGVADQYLRMVNTDAKSAQSERIFFTIWNRLPKEPPEPCVLLCRVNERNLALLGVTRSRPFVEALVRRLGSDSYPEAVLSSRMQGVEVVASAGFRPHVLFADFVAMPPNNGIDPATAGGLLFDSFGDSFLSEQMPIVEMAFPNIAEWLVKHSLLNKDAIRLLTTAHVQGHDLCGHSVPYDLRNPTRLKADPFIRTPLEELYADTQAMWMYSAEPTRSLLVDVLSEIELDAIPILIAMKRLTYYALKDADDLDSRCSWTMWGYWRKSGLIQPLKGKERQFFFAINHLPAVVEQMLSDILRVEREIALGENAYEQACVRFGHRFGSENPLTNRWEIPDELANSISLQRSLAG